MSCKYCIDQMCTNHKVTGRAPKEGFTRDWGSPIPCEMEDPKCHGYSYGPQASQPPDWGHSSLGRAVAIQVYKNVQELT